ncbi:hypothetical protein, partial [Mesorhizobium sp.]|uniref:hypothetical protein n=1 Tax=Mesorhizobium sp. TaxID=1871066 RepID=UPI00257C040D
ELDLVGPRVALGRLGNQGGHHRWNELKPAAAGTYNFTHWLDFRRTAYISQSEQIVIPQWRGNKNRLPALPLIRISSGERHGRRQEQA